MDRARCRLKVKGLDCSAEVAAIKAALKGEEVELEFDLAQGTVNVSYDPTRLGPRAIIDLIFQNARLEAEPIDAPQVEAPRSAWRERFADRRLVGTVASGIALGIGVACEAFFHQTTLARGFYLLAIVAGGIELTTKAIRSGLQKRLDIHVLMFLAIIGALILNQWDEAATVAFLFGLSETLESWSLERAPPRCARSWKSPPKRPN